MGLALLDALRWVESVHWLLYAYVGLGTTAAFAVFGWVLGGLADRLREQSIRDGLTGLLSRRFLDEELPRTLAASARRGEPVCLLLADLDHFKRINDQHGHLTGDRILVAIAKVFREHARYVDLVARYGGEEFVIVCTNATIAAGREIAERLRVAVETLDRSTLGFDGHVTISIGLSCTTMGYTQPLALLAAADQALYAAKAAGRNRTEVTAAHTTQA